MLNGFGGLAHCIVGYSVSCRRVRGFEPAWRLVAFSDTRRRLNNRSDDDFQNGDCRDDGAPIYVARDGDDEGLYLEVTQLLLQLPSRLLHAKKARHSRRVHSPFRHLHPQAVFTTAPSGTRRSCACCR